MTGAPLSDAQRDAIFASRAEALADVPTQPSEDTFEALVFALGSDFYAFPSPQVREVRPLPFVTRLPGTPALLSGLINVRGRIIPVIDLRPLLGAPLGDGPASSVVLISRRGGDIGMLATDRPTVREFSAADLRQPPDGAILGLDPSCVQGIAPGLVLVLDAERLLTDSRLVMHYDTVSKT